jgi:hypothetical protein
VAAITTEPPVHVVLSCLYQALLYGTVHSFANILALTSLAVVQLISDAIGNEGLTDLTKSYMCEKYMPTFFYFFYSYVHTMFESFLPPPPHLLPFHRLLPLLPTPLLPSRNYFALISNFVEERV